MPIFREIRTEGQVKEVLPPAKWMEFQAEIAISCQCRSGDRASGVIRYPHVYWLAQPDQDADKVIRGEEIRAAG